MSRILDERGKVFGRFNLIDLVAIVVVVVLIPMGFVTYRVFRQPQPVIESVAPNTLRADSPRRVRLQGRHFRPFLNAFVAKTNEPYSVPMRVPETVQAIFLIETPTVVELQLPAVPPGTYDIYLYDEGRQVAHVPSAVTLTAGERPVAATLADPVPDVAVLDIQVRFDVDPGILPLVKNGAVDLNRPDGERPATTAATLLSFKKIEAGGDVSLRMADGGRLTASVAAPRATLDALVRIGVTQNLGVWVYPVGQRIRPGEGFTFATPDYLMRGLITHIAAVRPVKGS